MIECNLAWIFPAKHPDSAKDAGRTGFNWAEEFTVCARAPPERYEIPAGLVGNLLEKSVGLSRQVEVEGSEEDEEQKETVQEAEEGGKENLNPNMAEGLRRHPHHKARVAKPERRP